MEREVDNDGYVLDCSSSRTRQHNQWQQWRSEVSAQDPDPNLSHKRQHTMEINERREALREAHWKRMNDDDPRQGGQNGFLFYMYSVVGPVIVFTFILSDQ